LEAGGFRRAIAAQLALSTSELQSGYDPRNAPNDTRTKHAREHKNAKNSKKSKKRKKTIKTFGDPKNPFLSVP
jgi:hypothetical protein